MHPSLRTPDGLARHALIERRTFIRGAVAAALGAGGAASLLTACGSDDPTATSTTTGLVPPLRFDAATPYWMQGGFAPVTEEMATAELEVTGSLPPELDGLYVRNGSNPASGPSAHWFLGDGMVHGVRLSAGKALWYRNRHVSTPLQQSGKGLFEFDGPPGGPNNQSNVSVFHHAGHLLTSGEVGFPYELSTDDLSTVGPYDFAGRLTTAMTAHPKIDPATGRMHFFGYGFTPPYLTYHVAAADGTLEYSAEIPVAGPTMLHDFAVTDTDAIFWELPVVFDLQAAIATLGGGEPDPGFGFRWDPLYGARVGVMPLEGPTSAIRWVEIDPCFVFHGVNAHRDGDEIVLDVCVLPSAFGEGGRLDPSTPHRWRIDTAGPELTFTDEPLVDALMDLPAIDRRFAGRESRHAWYLVSDTSTEFPVEFSSLCRRDDRDGSLDTYLPDPSRRVNEGTFVPGGPGEGEGWLVTYAWDRARGASDLLVLDALDLSAGPVAAVHLPARVPYGFHGCWVPAADLA